MKHCIIMTAYTDVDAINRFIQFTPTDWGIYIHLDKKSVIDKTHINNRAHVFQRKKVYWGAWEHVEVIIDLIKHAMSETDYDYYHVVSGQDFYAKNPLLIDEQMKEHIGANYVPLFPVPAPHWAWDGGMTIVKYRTLASFGDVRYGRIKRWNDKLHKLQRRFHFLMRSIPTCPLYGSSVYCSYHKDFARWMCTDQWAKKFMLHFRFSTCAEEIIFASLIMNSPYKNSVVTMSHYMNWGRARLVMNMNDYENIVNGNYLFCRKLDSQHSGELIDKLIDYIS